MREAAAAGDVGEVIRLVRRAHGLSQRQLGAATGGSQSTISRIERGGSGTRDVVTLRQLGSELDIAPLLLGLAGYPSLDKHSTTTSEPPVHRRDFVFSAPAAILASTALPGAVIAEEEAAATVHAITTAHRRLDGTTSARELAKPVAAQLRLAGHLRARIEEPRGRQAMAAAISEAAGLAGWLYWDMHDLGSARRHYRIAVEQAQRASGNSMLTVYMLGSLASFVVVQEGATDEGLALIRHAATTSEGERPATADAWLACIEAVAHASAGGDTQTWRALDRAEAAVERVAAEDPPPWPWVFPFDTRKIATHRLTCAVRLRRPDVAYAAAADLPASMTAGHRKQGALTLLDLACAHAQNQEVEEGLRVATVAIDLAATTRSERVLSRARQFRRAIPTATPPGPLRDFDEHLRIANTQDYTVR
ncbi:MAG: helix-turn-helix domain-containing protein [Pseudonocardiaceae bacterium]